MRAAWGWLMGAVLVAAGAAEPARAQPPEPHVVVGRADADASGGWPVLLWVQDGPRSHVIARAPRAQLSTLPGPTWRVADAQALMQLERFAAPRLEQRRDIDPCATSLAWGRILYPPVNAHWPGEREALAHADCGPGGCTGEAWRLDLPEDGGDALPLARLLPGLAAQRVEWLVLLVVSPAQSLTLEGLPQLRMPEALRWNRSFERWDKDVFPEQAAAHFPALHAALLEQQAAEQGLASASVLMRADPVSAVQRLRYLRSWDASAEQRQALGLAGEAVQGWYINRLLLRLDPGSRPASLRPRAVPWQAAELMTGLSALVAAPGDESACRQRLAAWRCEPSCAERIASLPAALKWGWYVDKPIPTLAPEDRPAACLRSCEAQRDALQASLPARFEAQAQRQRDAWRWVEELTGRPAASWQAR